MTPKTISPHAQERALERWNIDKPTLERLVRHAMPRESSQNGEHIWVVTDVVWNREDGSSKIGPMLLVVDDEGVVKTVLPFDSKAPNRRPHKKSTGKLP